LIVEIEDQPGLSSGVSVGYNNLTSFSMVKSTGNFWKHGLVDGRESMLSYIYHK
jgi:hypothetical protein